MGRRRIEIDGDWLKEQYVDKNIGTPTIAKMIGRSQGFIMKSLERHGIETKDKGSYNIPKGDKNCNWNGGRMMSDGYVYILCKEHPNKTTHGYVLEHRLIMEKHLGRYLSPTEVVHHKNGNPSDNRIENLEVKDRGQHVREHFVNKINISRPMAQEIADEILKSGLTKEEVTDIIIRMINR